MSQAPRSCVIAGAGLAGLTAAIDLVDAGWRVTLVERRPFAGGRTFSFEDAQRHLLDNGQHVFLGCCTAYLALLAKLGQLAKVKLQSTLAVSIQSGSRRATLREAPLPAPLHLLPSLLRFPLLTPFEKTSAAAAMLAIRRGGLPEDATFATWLRQRRQSENALRVLWDLITIPTCNAPAERISAAMGGFVFREGLLTHRPAARIGYARTGLSEIVPNVALQYLRGRGAGIRFCTGVSGRDGHVLLSSKGERLVADATILALPAPETAALVDQAWARFQLGHAPIVGINFWLDRPVLAGDFMAVVEGDEAFWLFDRTKILGLPGPEHHVAVSISAAERYMDTPRSELPGVIAAKLGKALGQAVILQASVEKVRAATFVPAPGSTRERPGPVTPIPGLFLAGAWTNTGWPDTMESAVRSGHAAAQSAQHAIQEASH